MIKPDWESPLALYADSEFCWNCAALLDEDTTVSVSFADIEHRMCCSERCAARAVSKANEPELTVEQARREAGVG